MAQRLNYPVINPKAVAGISEASKHLLAIDPRLKAVIELRVSQINGCAYCVDLHAQEARAAGESQQRIDCVAVWQECGFFNERESAALDWAEALTHVADVGGPQELFDELKAHFSDEEIVDLTLIIAVMNAWNRLGVGFNRRPRLRED